MALSIAYGIQADSPDNEFVRSYQNLLDASHEALVPGAFLVDLVPFRGSHRFPTVRRRALVDDVLL